MSKKPLFTEIQEIRGQLINEMEKRTNSISLSLELESYELAAKHQTEYKILKMIFNKLSDAIMNAAD